MHEFGFSIDDEFANRLPSLTAFELDQLRDNILQDEMIREPLVIWQEEMVLIDGHHRLQIYDDLDEEDEIEPPELVYQSFESREEVLHFIDRNAIGKRNVGPDNEKIIRGRIYNHRKKRAGAPEGSRNAAKNNVAKSATLNRTEDVVAEELGVSPRTVRNDGQRAEVYDAVQDRPDLAEAVATMPQSDVSTVINTAKEINGSRSKAIAEAAERVVTTPKPKPKFPLSMGFTKILQDIAGALMLIHEDHGSFRKMTQHAEWDKKDTKIIKQLLNSVIQSLEEIKNGR